MTIHCEPLATSTFPTSACRRLFYTVHLPVHHFEVATEWSNWSDLISRESNHEWWTEWWITFPPPTPYSCDPEVFDKRFEPVHLRPSLFVAAAAACGASGWVERTSCAIGIWLDGSSCKPLAILSSSFHLVIFSSEPHDTITRPKPVFQLPKIKAKQCMCLLVFIAVPAMTSVSCVDFRKPNSQETVLQHTPVKEALKTVPERPNSVALLLLTRWHFMTFAQSKVCLG